MGITSEPMTLADAERLGLDPDEVQPLPEFDEDAERDLDLHCERCGSQRIENIDRPLPEEPYNHCLDCGLISEYVPTRATLAAVCAEMRLRPQDDWGQERFSHRRSQGIASNKNRCPRCRHLVHGECGKCELEQAVAAGAVQPPRPEYRRPLWRIALATLPIGKRSLEQLDRAGVVYVGDLLTRFEPADVARFSHLGPAGLRSIRRGLASIGVEW